MFSPTSGGNFSANLEIEHNAINLSSPLIIQLSGESLNYEPKIAVNRTSPWDFGSVSTCLTTEQTIRIQNIGADPLYIRDVFLSSATEYSIKSIDSSSGENKSVPCTLGVGIELEVEIEFAPQANIQYNDKLNISHNGINANNPIVLDLVGVGNPVTTKVFQFTGAPQQFVVPAGVTRLKLELWGGEGGLPYPTYPQTTAGKGGYVVGFINVTPGETYEIYVGGKGQDGVLGAGGAGGWNGGGCGDSAPGPQYYGPGGGGASDIRFGGNTLYDRIIVAGAGGGAAAYMADCDGGAGGGLEGGNGILTGSYDYMYCGGGGTQERGGTRTKRPFVTFCGVFGIGGDAKDVLGYDYGSGGGGGAGWYGGGGGNMGGAGGGSSYTDPQKIFGVQHQQGIHTGDGKIKISY